jgi:hypothetical protein
MSERRPSSDDGVTTTALDTFARDSSVVIGLLDDSIPK